MQIDRRQIVTVLEDRGDHEQAQRAQRELPDPVDTEQHEDDLRRFGISHDELPGWTGAPQDEDDS